jgi:hypothetical protein
MLVAPAADRGPILFKHRFQHFQARSNHELGQLGARVNQQIDQRQMPGFRFLCLRNGVDCARLLHGGSFRCGLRRGLAHQSFSTTSGGAADSIFNSYWDIPLLDVARLFPMLNIVVHSLARIGIALVLAYLEHRLLVDQKNRTV